MEENCLVEATDSFRAEVKNRLSKHGRIARAVREMRISRRALYQFLDKGVVRQSTFATIVRKFAGEDADPEDYKTQL